MSKQSKKCGTGENEVARLLGPWWSQHEPGTRFWRTPGSGGWAARRDVPPGFLGRGDLMVDRELTRWFPFCVEVKRREGWSWDTFLGERASAEGKVSPVWRWWEQNVTAALADSTIPLMWFRKNRSPWSVMVPSAIFSAVRVPPCHRLICPLSLSAWNRVVVFVGADFLRLAPRLLASRPPDALSSGRERPAPRQPKAIPASSERRAPRARA